MTRSHTEAALTDAARPLRRSVLWLGAIGAGAGLAGVLAVAAWSARVGMVHAPVWVLVAWTVALLAAAGCALLAARAARAFRAAGVASRLEGQGQWRSGALRALLEPATEGTSPGLRAAADAATADDLRHRAAGALDPERRRLGRLLRIALGTVVVGGTLLGAAGVRSGPAALLWRPAHALAMVVSPLRLETDKASVKAGDSVALLVLAPGRRQVTLWTRSPGTTWVAAAITWARSGLPPTSCRTLGCFDFRRVPLPAARMAIAVRGGW